MSPCTEIPTLKAKNDWPRAYKIVLELSPEKSGIRKKETPRAALSNVNDLMIRIINEMNKRGHS